MICEECGLEFLIMRQRGGRMIISPRTHNKADDWVNERPVVKLVCPDCFNKQPKVKPKPEVYIRLERGRKGAIRYLPVSRILRKGEAKVLRILERAVLNKDGSPVLYEFQGNIMARIV